MKKIILGLLMISSFYVVADFTFVNSQQKAGQGGNSVFGKSEDGNINNNDYK